MYYGFDYDFYQTNNHGSLDTFYYRSQIEKASELTMQIKNKLFVIREYKPNDYIYVNIYKIYSDGEFEKLHFMGTEKFYKGHNKEFEILEKTIKEYIEKKIDDKKLI